MYQLGEAQNNKNTSLPAAEAAAVAAEIYRSQRASRPIGGRVLFDGTHYQTDSNLSHVTQFSNFAWKHEPDGHAHDSRNLSYLPRTGNIRI